MKPLEVMLAIAALRDDIRMKRLPSDTTKTLRALLPVIEAQATLVDVVKEWAEERKTFLSGETPQLRAISERMVALVGETIQ